jgi:hypothetical protein
LPKKKAKQKKGGRGICPKTSHKKSVSKSGFGFTHTYTHI